MMGFIIWSIVALLFLGIGISARRAQEAVGFFTFTDPPKIREVKRYNRAVSLLWFVSAAAFEALGVPLLLFEQNSPAFLLLILAVVLLVLAMMFVYTRIENRYRA